LLVIGLISGTSVDGIDTALVEISGTVESPQVQLLAGETYPYSPRLRETILQVCGGEKLDLEALASLDDDIAEEFAQAALNIQKETPKAQLIGSHGQTVFHRPPANDRLGYTVQLGRGAAIAKNTRIPTISNFRAADIAQAGHGAPLVPKIDAYLLSHPTKARWQQNIFGWDTGPGNVLIDLAVQFLSQGQQTYDHNGQWSAQGQPCSELVHKWLQEPYFQQYPPKSTGRELFSPAYLAQLHQDAQAYSLSDADWLASLTDLTAISIAHSYQTFLPEMPAEVLLCGGGARNAYLRQRLLAHLGSNVKLLTTDELGLNSDFKEAIAFALLAYWRWHNFPGNLPQVTGAKAAVLLGEIYL
jgi:anhydro-N-acetylmuramic acid kinase